MSLVGCAHHRVRRLLREGEFEEGIVAATEARRPVRGATARALAAAQVELSQWREARALLQADFRRGGDVKSLHALASLESSLGLDGIAALRWSRLAQLAPRLVANDEDACRILLARGAARQRWSEFAAADRDLELVEALCREGALRRLAAEATARRAKGYGAAVRDVVRRHAPVRCEPEACRAWGGVVAGDSAEPDEERAGAAARYVAHATREFQGRGGVIPERDEEVLARLGHTSRTELDAALRDVRDDVAAYVRLRVSRVWSDATLAPAERRAMMLRMEAAGAGGANGWMLRWLEGDFTFAEFDVTSRLRGMLAASASADDDGPGSAGADFEGSREGHWAQAVPVEEGNVRLLLALARLLARKGDSLSSLRLRASVIAAIERTDIASGETLIYEEVLAVLAEGRPWSALALSSLMASTQARHKVARAAWSWIGLSQALCDGQCGEAEDREVVTSFVTAAELAELDGWILNVERGRDLTRDDDHTGCGLAWRELASDSEWARLVRHSVTGDGADDAASLATASEVQPLLGCRTRLLVERLGVIGARDVLEVLAERREGAGEEDSSMAAESDAVTLLAMGAGRRAMQRFEAAAALSSDPRAVWVRAYVSSSVGGAREVSLRALREIVLHSRPDEARVARRQLALGPWKDLMSGDAGPSQETDARVRSRGLTLVWEMGAGGSRWASVEWMMASLLRVPGASLAGALRVIGALQQVVPLERHGSLMDTVFVGTARRSSASATMSEILSECGDSSESTPGRDAAVRCLERILGGTRMEAAQVMARLLERLPLEQRRAVLLWMLDAPEGWGASGEELFPSPELNLRLALGLPIGGWVDLEGPLLDTTLLR
jgi:hypothetical protein